MRSYSFFSLIGIAFGFIFLSQACPPPSPKGEVRYTKDCHPDRQTQSELANKKGILQKAGQEFVIILAGEESTRYLPCNLEEKFKVENSKVVFSGKVKEIFPNERWPGTPFVLSSILLE